MSPIIYFCFLEAESNDEGLRPIISKSIDELGITFEQAMKVCEELNNHKTIAAWMTSYTKTSVIPSQMI